MGVPSLYRYLTTLWPRIALDAVGDELVQIDGKPYPTNTACANPNNIEFDNLYLDMNGIIHPCSSPDANGDSPTEERIFLNIFEYIDRIFAFVRPRKVLYLAIDGVAPRAKMNQQRQRRFRAAEEAQLFTKVDKELRDIFTTAGKSHLIPPQSTNTPFDKNVITPGTPFMSRLSEALRYFISVKLENDPGWANLSVILSDASVPGEGEHKILHFVRNQRSLKGYDINTTHCLYGMDADLIFLGLASHEPRFYIIREIVFARSEMVCSICKRCGHHAGECKGLTETANITRRKIGLNFYLPPEQISQIRKSTSQRAQVSITKRPQQPFQFLSLSTMREYLQHELAFPSQLFDLENAINDWILLCFFVGNDFLPHLSAFSIRDNAIHVMQKLWKSLMLSKVVQFEEAFISKHLSTLSNLNLSSINSTLDIPVKLTKDQKIELQKQIYLTTDGEVNLPQFYDFLQKLASYETAILQSKRSNVLWQTRFSAQKLMHEAKDAQMNLLRKREVEQQHAEEEFGKQSAHFNKNDKMGDKKSGSNKDGKRKEPGEGFENDSTTKSKQADLSSSTLRNDANLNKSVVLDPQMDLKRIQATNQYHYFLMKINPNDLEKAENKLVAMQNDDDSQDANKSVSTISKSDTISVELSTISNPNQTDSEKGGMGDGLREIASHVDQMTPHEILTKRLRTGTGDVSKLIELNPYIAWTAARTVIREKMDVLPPEVDPIQLGTKDYAKRYYFEHFNIKDQLMKNKDGGDVEKGNEDEECEESPAVRSTFVNLDALTQSDLDHVHLSYITGLRWVFHYYFKGCSSWSWHYPFHFPPLLTELAAFPLGKYYSDISSPLNYTDPSLRDSRPSHTIVSTSLYSSETPVLPYEQLLSVFPPQSAHALPAPYAALMTQRNSPIADFYPSQFGYDSHGASSLWLAVAKLPYIDIRRLRRTVIQRSCDAQLSCEEIERNRHGENYLFTRISNTSLSKKDPQYGLLSKNFNTIKQVSELVGEKYSNLYKQSKSKSKPNPRQITISPRLTLSFDEYTSLTSHESKDWDDIDDKTQTASNRLAIFQNLHYIFLQSRATPWLPPTTNTHPNSNKKYAKILHSAPDFEHPHDLLFWKYDFTTIFSTHPTAETIASLKSTIIVEPALHQLTAVDFAFHSESGIYLRGIVSSMFNEVKLNKTLRAPFTFPSHQSLAMPYTIPIPQKFKPSSVISFVLRLPPANKHQCDLLDGQLQPRPVLNPQDIGALGVIATTQRTYTFEYLSWILCGGDVDFRKIHSTGVDSIPYHVLVDLSSPAQLVEYVEKSHQTRTSCSQFASLFDPTNYPNHLSKPRMYHLPNTTYNIENVPKPYTIQHYNSSSTPTTTARTPARSSSSKDKNVSPGEQILDHRLKFLTGHQNLAPFLSPEDIFRAYKDITLLPCFIYDGNLHAIRFDREIDDDDEYN